jgi:hypothetical protein
MYVRSWLVALLLFPVTGCFGIESEAEAKKEGPCPIGEAQWPDKSCAPCVGGNVVEIGDQCVPCAEREVRDGNTCVPCSTSCEGIECGGANQCGDPCGCWSGLRVLGPVMEQTERCPIDPAELDLQDSPAEGARYPGTRENACVAYDAPNDAFLVFGGQRVGRWAESSVPCNLPPPAGNGECDTRRTCDLNDTWLVRIDDEGAATWEHKRPVERPLPRADPTCVATPAGVLMFGGSFSTVNDQGVSHRGWQTEDLWWWRAGEWTRAPNVLGVGDLSSAPAAWDPVNSELVVVGGCLRMSYIPRRICSGDPASTLTCAERDQIEENGFDWPGGASVVWDPFAERMLVIGGTPGTIEVDMPGGKTIEPACGADLASTSRVWSLRRGGPGEKGWVFEQLASQGLGAGETAAVAAGAHEVLRVGGIDRDPEITLDSTRYSTLDESCMWLESGTWECVRPLSKKHGPPKRDQANLAWDGRQYLLVGGSGGNGLSSEEFWRFLPPVRH